MPSENYKSKRYGPTQPAPDGGVESDGYGGGAHVNDHPGYPNVFKIVDESRRHELGGIRDKIGDDFNVSRAELEHNRRLLGDFARMGRRQ